MADKPSTKGVRRTESPAHAAKPAARKYTAVADALRREIESGVWAQGERVSSEQDIAKRFGVAYMTARQAVSSLVSAGILERVPRKGTFVARPSRPEVRNQFVLLIEGGKASLDPYYLPPIIDAFEQEIKTHGHEVSIYDYSTAILDGLIPRDALICCVLLSKPEVLYANLLRERGNRVYAINRCPPGGPVRFVAPDNVGGARAAVSHLIGLGHRRIGFVRGLPDNIDAAERRQGYLQALGGHGLPVGPEFGDHFVEVSGYDAARRMMAEAEPPTAIFCASDLSAIGAMKALAEAGLSVPGDVSVVGFGDFPVAKFLHPGLTSVRLPLSELGATAAREMLRMAQGQKVEDLYLPCDLIVRDTSDSAATAKAAV